MHIVCIFVLFIFEICYSKVFLMIILKFKATFLRSLSIKIKRFLVPSFWTALVSCALTMKPFSSGGALLTSPIDSTGAPKRCFVH